MEYAKLNLDPQLGANPQNRSYITGVGDFYPMDPLQHPSDHDGIVEPVPGIPVFGPHSHMTLANSYNAAAQIEANLHPKGEQDYDPYPTLRRYFDIFELVAMSEFGVEYMGSTMLPFAFFSTVNADVEVRTNVLLQAAYKPATGLMNTHLRSANLLPITQPFDRPPWNYGGLESVSDTADFPLGMVDWILVEVREASDNSIIIEQLAALLMNDGRIIDVQYANNPTENTCRFKQLMANTDYYISLKTRNHLAVLSANPIQLPNPTPLDFSDPLQVSDGGSQLADMGNGQFALLAGDFNSDGVISVTDFNLYTTQTALINQYADADANLDKNVTVADFNWYLPNTSAIGVTQIRY